MTPIARAGSGPDGAGPSPGASPPGRRLSYWITQVLRREREAVGITPAQVASALGDRTTTNVDRLEKAEGEFAEFWGRDIDRAVYAYGWLLGLDDPRELWERALQLWHEEGAPPDFSEDLPQLRFARPIREEALRRKQAPGGSTETRASKRKRREGR